jgi:hypothetical protein
MDFVFWAGQSERWKLSLLTLVPTSLCLTTILEMGSLEHSTASSIKPHQEKSESPT